MACGHFCDGALLSVYKKSYSLWRCQYNTYAYVYIGLLVHSIRLLYHYHHRCCVTFCVHHSTVYFFVYKVAILWVCILIVRVYLLMPVDFVYSYATHTISMRIQLSILIRASGGHSSNNINWANQVTKQPHVLHYGFFRHSCAFQPFTHNNNVTTLKPFYVGRKPILN